MKRIVAAFGVVFILLTSVLFVNVSAVGDITVSSAHFDAQVNTDGTVDVTEKWSIEYMETGDGFTRWIDLYDSKNSNSMTALEKFDSINNVKVSVNGKELSESQSGNNTFRKGQAADGSSFNVKVDSPSADEVKEYVITYTLDGAVKKNGKNAEFAYVFLGETFEFVSNNVTATVILPENAVNGNIVIDENSGALISGNKVEFAPGRVYSTFRVDVKCDADIFEDGALADYSQFKESMKKAGKIILDVLYWILIAVILIAVIILALFSDKIKRHSFEKQAKKQNNIQISDLDAAISPCMAYKMVVPYSRINPKKSSKRVVQLFAVAILECIENGYIIESDGELMVGTPADEVPSYIMSVLNFLKSFSEERHNRYMIGADFAERIEAECVRSYDVMANYLATFYNLIPSVDSKFFNEAENKDLYKKVYILKNQLNKEKRKVAFDKSMRNVLAGEKAGTADNFALMFASSKKVFDYSSDDCASVVTRALSAMNDCFVKFK